MIANACSAGESPAGAWRRPRRGASTRATVGASHPRAGVVAPNSTRTVSESDKRLCNAHANATAIPAAVTSTSTTSTRSNAWRTSERGAPEVAITHSRSRIIVGSAMMNALSSARTARAGRGSRVQRSVGRRNDRGHHIPHHSGGQNAMRVSSRSDIPSPATFQSCNASPAGTRSAMSTSNARSPIERNGVAASPVHSAAQMRA